MANRLEGLLKGAFAPEGVVALLHPVKADLDLMNTKFSGNVLGNQGAVGEENRSEGIVSQNGVHFPEVGMEQGLAPGEEETKPVNFFELVAYVVEYPEGKILMATLSKITVATLKVASIRQ